MEKTKRVVRAFLNSAEGYFHLKRVLQDQVKQPRDLYGPMSDRPERWDYTDVRDITPDHMKMILASAYSSIDWDLYSTIPSSALHASLQGTIHSMDNGRFQSKFDANMYNFLFKVLALKANKKKG